MNEHICGIHNYEELTNHLEEYENEDEALKDQAKSVEVVNSV